MSVYIAFVKNDCFSSFLFLVSHFFISLAFGYLSQCLLSVELFVLFLLLKGMFSMFHTKNDSLCKFLVAILY